MELTGRGSPWASSLGSNDGYRRIDGTQDDREARTLRRDLQRLANTYLAEIGSGLCLPQNSVEDKNVLSATSVQPKAVPMDGYVPPYSRTMEPLLGISKECPQDFFSNYFDDIHPPNNCNAATSVSPRYNLGPDENARIEASIGLV